MVPAGPVVATIPAPSTGGIGIGAGSVWVANTLTNTVTRIDPESNRVVATIPTGRSPEDLFHGPTRVAVGHGAVWVADGRSVCSCVHRIDASSNSIVETIRLGTPTLPDFRLAPLGIAVTPDAVWIALRHGREEDALAGSVVRVDPLTNQVVAVVPLGSSTDGGGPTRIAASVSGVWVGIPSSRSVVRIDPGTNAVVATIPGLTCGEGELGADDSGGVWVADCDAVRQIDPSTNDFSRTVKVPSPTLSNGTRGLAVGLGYVWAQSDVLTRIDPATGAIHGTLELDPALVWGEYSVATGFGSVWVRQIDRVVRIDP
jgi:YVTN family beta-propeller protein